MEKVKLTKEQAEAIEYFRKTFVENPKTSMSNETLIAALNHGYEVEPEFKVGDWVVWDDMKIIGQLVEIDSELRVDAIEYDFPQDISLKFLRHATPEEIQQEKERRWWSKHGREVWELKVGDFLINENLGTIEEVKEIKWQKYLIGKWTAYMELDYIKDNYSVAFFVEDRKDI